jgi:hypothetical protein
MPTKTPVKKTPKTRKKKSSVAARWRGQTAYKLHQKRRKEAEDTAPETGIVQSRGKSGEISVESYWDGYADKDRGAREVRIDASPSFPFDDGTCYERVVTLYFNDPERLRELAVHLIKAAAWLDEGKVKKS